MRRLAIAVGILVVTAGLAGCIGDDGAETQTQSSSANDTTPTLADPNVSFGTTEDVYAYDAETVHEVRWENNSFSPATCFACPNSEHRIDVTSMLPKGAPSVLQAEVDASANAFDAVSLDLVAEGAQTYRVNDTFQSVDAALAPQSGSVELIVENLFPDANTEIAYELRIRVDANRSRLPAAAPTEVPVPRKPAGLVAEAHTEGPARLMLWDGEDAFLGHQAIEGRTTINVSEADGGPLVAYLAGTEGTLSLAPVNASATDTAMRPLATSWSEATAAVKSGTVEVPAQPGRVPLQGALFLRGSFDTGTQYAGELTTGNGTLVSFESGGYLTLDGTRFTWPGEPGAAELGPDPLLGTFEFSQTTGGEAGVAWQTYQR